ncbi:MAG: hypothetical protein ABIQ88_15015 [Chitinophagaceae bacterium]
MKKNLQDIDKVFKDALDDHLEPVPAGVWDALNNDLDKKQAFHYRKKYYRTKRLALLLLLLVFSGIAYQLFVAAPGKTNTGVVQTQLPAALQKNGQDVSLPVKKPATAKELVTTETAPDAGNAAVRKGDIVAAETTAATEKKSSNQAKIELTEKKAANTINPTVARTLQLNKPAAAMKAQRRDNTKRTQEQVASLQKNNTLQQTLSSGKANSKLDSKPSSKALTLATTDIGRDDLSAGAIISVNIKHTASQLHTANGKTNTAVIQPIRRLVSPIAAYQYQPPLYLSETTAVEVVAFTAMPSMLLLDNTAANSSLQKEKSPAETKQFPKHPISLMAFASPNHSFRRLENDNRLSGPVLNKKLAEQQEQQVASYSVGLLVNYGIGKKLILQSGLVFSSAKTNIAPKTIFARPDNSGRTKYEFNCSSGSSFLSPKTGTVPAVGDSIHVMGSSSTLTYIGVPLSLNYVWKKGKFLIKPGIGLSVNFLTSGKSATSFGASVGHQKETASINGLKTAYVDGSLGLGAEFMLNQRFSVGLRPLLRMALTAVNRDTPIRTYQNYVSLETGIKINL